MSTSAPGHKTTGVSGDLVIANAASPAQHQPLPSLYGQHHVQWFRYWALRSLLPDHKSHIN